MGGGNGDEWKINWATAPFPSPSHTRMLPPSSHPLPPGWMQLICWPLFREATPLRPARLDPVRGRGRVQQRSLSAAACCCWHCLFKPHFSRTFFIAPSPLSHACFSCIALLAACYSYTLSHVPVAAAAALCGIALAFGCGRLQPSQVHGWWCYLQASTGKNPAS
jgi:hypothetical protein